MHRRVRAARQPLFLFVYGQQAEKLSLSASSLGWAEGALKRHARGSDGDAAIEVLELLLRVLGRSLGSRGAWPMELMEELRSLTTAMIWF